MPKVLDAGHRERQALLRLWDSLPTSRVSRLATDDYMPFWLYLSKVDYDPVTDTFTLPDGTKKTVEECNNLETTCSTPA